MDPVRNPSVMRYKNMNKNKTSNKLKNKIINNSQKYLDDISYF